MSIELRLLVSGEARKNVNQLKQHNCYIRSDFCLKIISHPESIPIVPLLALPQSCRNGYIDRISSPNSSRKYCSEETEHGHPLGTTVHSYQHRAPHWARGNGRACKGTLGKCVVCMCFSLVPAAICLIFRVWISIFSILNYNTFLVLNLIKVQNLFSMLNNLTFNI